MVNITKTSLTNMKVAALRALAVKSNVSPEGTKPVLVGRLCRVLCTKNAPVGINATSMRIMEEHVRFKSLPKKLKTGQTVITGELDGGFRFSMTIYKKAKTEPLMSTTLSNDNRGVYVHMQCDGKKVSVMNYRTYTEDPMSNIAFIVTAILHHRLVAPKTPLSVYDQVDDSAYFPEVAL